MKEPGRIEISQEDLEKLLKRLEDRQLSDADYEVLKGLAQTVSYLNHVVQEKGLSIKRLLRRIFGVRTEHAKNILKKDIGADRKASDEENKPIGGGSGPANATTDKKKKPAKGHGRNGASAYTGADRIKIPHESLKRGCPCPNCPKGKVYPMPECGVIVSIIGQAPLKAEIEELEKLRCNACGEVFTAAPSSSAGKEKYDETAGAMIALLKYGSGTPFYRIEKLQESLGVPLPASTQWAVVEKVADLIHPVHSELIRQAAQGTVIYNDDTQMKILELMKKRRDESGIPGGQDSRTGIFTTGILSECEGRRIALFFTGGKHAGENMRTLLAKRSKERSPPIQMCDALSRNIAKEFEVILANCLSHARRNFVDALISFPEKCRYVIETLAEIYKNDAIAREQKMSPVERLRFHQEESGSFMKELETWLDLQMDEKKAEPNSSMGKAISYMLNHWEALTLFLRVPGAPLDNNLCEQVLKRAILNRKNSMFYKTEHGAKIGDIFMSLIHTCTLVKVNPFDYLTTLQKNSTHLFKNPERWMPWNYHLNGAVNPS